MAIGRPHLAHPRAAPPRTSECARARSRAGAWLALAAAVIVATVGALAAPPAAHAGLYDIQSCGAAPGSVNNAWVFHQDTNTTTVQACPAGSDAQGLGGVATSCTVIGDLNGAGPVLFLPSGLRWTQATVRDRYARAGNGCGFYGPGVWSVGLGPWNIADGGPELRGCGGQGTATCLAGTGYAGAEVTVTNPDPARWPHLIAEFACYGPSGCATTGAFGYTTNIYIYSSKVRVEDWQSPVMGDVQGGLSNTSAWLRGTHTIRFDATDESGIRYTRFTFDGIVRNNDAEPCDGNATAYTYVIPCGTGAVGARSALNINDRTYSFDTTTVANGAHTTGGTGGVKVEAWDSTGRAWDGSALASTAPGTLAYSVSVDNLAPVAPASVADGTGADVAWQTVNATLAANWPAGSDSHSGVRDYGYCFSTVTSCGGTIVGGGTSSYVAATNLSAGGLTLTQGTQYFACIRTRDNAIDSAGNPGNLSGWTCSNGSRYDSVAPTNPASIADGPGADIAWVASTTQLQGNWPAGTDATSGIADYDWCFTTNAGNSCAAAGRVAVGTNLAATSVTSTGLSLTQGTTYYLCVRARDVAGNVAASYACSNGQQPDTGAPTVTVVSPPDDYGIATWPALTATYTDAAPSSPGRILYDLCTTAACTVVVQSGTSSSTSLATGTNGSWTPAVANGSYYWRARAQDAAGNQSAWSSTRFIMVGVASASVGIDSPTRSFGTAVPGSDSTATTVVTVQTNAVNGYQLLAADASNTAGLDDGAGHTVPDWTGTVATPSVWAAGLAGYVGTTVRDATGGRLAKWGPGTGTAATDMANNRYAGLTTAAQLLHSRSGYAPAAETVTVTYRSNVAASQAPGTYSTTIQFSLVTLP